MSLSESPSPLPWVIAPPKQFQAAYEACDAETKAILFDRLTSDLSAEWLADLLSGAGFPISATSIRTWRRRERRRKEGAS